MGSADFRLVRPVTVAGDVAFSRASPKWVFDKTGTLVQVPANTLAVTYDPSDLSKAPYPLLEPATTNYISSSEDFGIYWAGYFAKPSVTKGYPAPDGSNNATRLGSLDNGGGSYPAISGLLTYNNTGNTLSGKFVCSIWARCVSGTLSINFGIDDGGIANYTLTTAWQRLVYVSSERQVANGQRIMQILEGIANNVEWEVWGAQVEINPAGVPSSYISTAGAPAERAADVIGAGAGLVYSNVPIVEVAYNSGTTYAQGVVVYDPATYLTYQSLIANNVGKPLTDGASWGALKRVVNRRLMFDKVVNSQTTAPDEVTVVIQPGELVNTLGILNVEGSSVTVAQSDSGYSQTKSMVSHEPLSWYDFFYNEPIREGDVIFDGIPPYANSVLSISVINPGAQAAIGCCIVGKAQTIGQTAWDFTGGILSYSSSSTDPFGNVTMVKRDNSKVLNFEVYIPKGFESAAYRLLSKEFTDVEIMIIGAEDYSMTYAYGFLGQWNVPVSAGGEKTAHIEFKGLV